VDIPQTYAALGTVLWIGALVVRDRMGIEISTDYTPGETPYAPTRVPRRCISLTGRSAYQWLLTTANRNR
jgi:hypothetical protein